MRFARMTKWAGIVAGALVLLVLALAIGLDTSPGRSFLAGRLAAYETASGIRVEIGRIDGSLYGHMVLRDLKVRDQAGIFASAPLIDVDWRPFAYLHRRIDVRSLSAPEVTVARAPQLKPTPSDPNAPILPDIDLAVGHFAIGRLTLEAPLTGQRHIVAARGSVDIADRRARIALDGEALRAAGVAGGDRLTLRLDAVPDENRLQIAGKLDAPAGGLVDSYTKLGRPLALAVDGRGDWAHWQGRLIANTCDLHPSPSGEGMGVGRVSLTEGDVRVDRPHPNPSPEGEGLARCAQSLADLTLDARNGSFHVTGPLRPALLLTGPAARLTEPAIVLDATATLDKRKVDLDLKANSVAFALQSGGLIDLGASRFGAFRLSAQLLRPGVIAPNLAGRDVRVQAVLDGPMARPSVDYRIDAAALAFGATGVEGLSAHGTAQVNADRILVPVAATVRRVSGLNASLGGLVTNVRLDGDLAYANGRVLSDNLHLRSDRIDATAIVAADLPKGRYTGAIKGRVDDYEVNGLGRVNLVTDAHLVTAPGGGFGIAGRVRVETKRLTNASVADALGGQAVITADVGYDQNGVATVRNLRLTARKLRIVSGEGSYRSDGRIVFEARGVSADYGPVSVEVHGTIAKPVARIVAAKPGLGAGLSDVVADIEGTGAGYHVRAKGNSLYGPFAADVLVQAGKGPAAFRINRATFAGVAFAGTVTQTAAGPFAGTLTLDGSGLTGSVRLAAAGKVQRADIDLAANAARIPGATPITIGGGRIRATALLYPGAPQIAGSASLTDLRSGATLVSSLQARIDYRGGRGTVQLVAKGSSGVPFDVAAQASLTPQLIRANLRGSANGIAFRLAAPAEIVKAGAGWQLRPAAILLPQGRVDVSGRTAPELRGQAIVRNLDLALADAFAPGLGLGGKASGTIDFAMPSGAAVPRLRSRLDIAGFTRTSALTVSDPVDVATLATLTPQGGEADALIRRGGGTVGRLKARLAPLGGGASLTQRLMAAPLSGGIRYNGPAEILWTLTGIAGQTLTGPVAVAADFGGRLAQPTLTGVVRANALRYENQAYGTALTRLAIDGRFTQSQLQLASLSAAAGKGTLSASGTIGLDAANGFPIDLTARLDDAQLARSNALSATVSGTVHITNSRAAGGLVQGDLRIPTARYEIVRQGAAEVPELTGVRRKGEAPPNAEAAAGPPSNWKLDIRVRAADRVYVSGMGLEAEWRTDLRVRGSSNDPRIVGKLEVVRGTYSFAGRRFDVSNTSDVTFDGGPAVNPQLAISATTTVEGVTATITIAGHAQNPQISFTSTPTLPQDEVLSRILFGASVTSLSPVQALQLAAALNSLRSPGGGLNPLGKVRNALGIDRLRVLGADQTAGRGTSVAAGKYISSKIYVEVVTDAKGFTATELDISLSRALSILSQTSSAGTNSVGLKYSKDY